MPARIIVSTVLKALAWSATFNSFKDENINQAIERMLDYIQYGAEAIFFDDSIFWGGNVGLIINFCREWNKIREEAAWNNSSEVTLMGRTVDRRKLLSSGMGRTSDSRLPGWAPS